MELLINLIVFVLGFVGGALVFRNNASKGEALVQKAEAEAKVIAAKVAKK
jgi:hypothetical protein